MRIGILNCSNATQDLGCSSAACLADLRKKRGAFAGHSGDTPLVIVGIINCPGCPTLAGYDRILSRVRSLTEFRLDALHIAYCMKALCPFLNRYSELLRNAFPGLKIVVGTHEEHLSTEEFRCRVSRLFAQPQKNMTDLILNRDR